MCDDITLCLTIGNRPVELDKTLASLLQVATFSHIIAINDFGDKESNEVFYRHCPHGILINLGKHVGHHAAVDAMYQRVSTTYIFHCEDDWLFTNKPLFEEAKILLEAQNISQVCFRKIEDFPFYEEQKTILDLSTYQEISYHRIDFLHAQWFGFTFNPSLFKRVLWQEAGSFSSFNKERHISKWQRKKRHFVAYIYPGSCHHIGDNFSVAHSNKKTSILKSWRRIIKKKLGLVKI